MGAKLSAKRLLAVAAVFVLAMVAFPVLQDSRAADYFDQQQWIDVYNNTSFAGGVYRYNYNTGGSDWELDWGSWSYNYQLPFGAWVGLFYYSYYSEDWEEVVFLMDENW